MRAAVYHGPGDVRIEEVPEPSPGPGEVKIRLAHNGICGSDLHEYYSAATFIPVEPHPQTGVKAPVILGHEFSGTVVEVGDGVTDVAVGQEAALRPTYSCGTCASCRAGLPNICRVLAFHGLSALVEPMAVGHHAVDRSGATADDL